ncbi:MAG: hypothetical protein WAK53_14120 [Chromatiaceae bacterium]
MGLTWEVLDLDAVGKGVPHPIGGDDSTPGVKVVGWRGASGY